LLCSLPDLSDNFVISMLYGKDTISLADVKFALRARLNGKGSEIRQRVYLLVVIWKIALILEVDLEEETQIGEANCSLTQRTK